MKALGHLKKDKINCYSLKVEFRANLISKLSDAVLFRFYLYLSVLLHLYNICVASA